MLDGWYKSSNPHLAGVYKYQQNELIMYVIYKNETYTYEGYKYYMNNWISMDDITSKHIIDDEYPKAPIHP